MSKGDGEARPTVAILLATYNGEQYLVQQIDSIVSQSYQEWVLYVSDDGSTDGTMDIIDDYQDTLGDRLKVISHSPYGSHAVNFLRGFAAIDADYLMACDQDDVWFEDKVAVSVRAMQTEEARTGVEKPLLGFTDLVVTDEKLKELSGSLYSFEGTSPACRRFGQLLLQSVASGNTMIVNRALNALLATCDEYEDIVGHDEWASLVATGTGGEIFYIDQPTLYYRQHVSNVAGASDWGSAKTVREKVQSSPQCLLMQRIRQARRFLTAYGPYLDCESLQTVTEFSWFPSLPYAARVRSCFRYHLWKHGAVRKMGQLVYLMKLPHELS
jgi:glycosyltransferase involved in cell wall biosynthesis